MYWDIVIAYTGQSIVPKVGWENIISGRIHCWILVVQHLSNRVTWGNYERRGTFKYCKNLSHWNLRANWDGMLGGIKNWFNHKNRYLVGFMRVVSNYMCKTFTKKQIWLIGVELIIKVDIIKIVWCESCSMQRFMVEEWSLLLVSKVAFSRNSTEFSIVFWNWKFSISRV
jgi:hypothetical protein